MALAARLERFLARKGISYRELPIDQVIVESRKGDSNLCFLPIFDNFFQVF